MIEKLIDKYKKKLKYITDLKNKTSFELVRVSCLEKEFIVKEIIQDLEELKRFLISKKDNSPCVFEKHVYKQHARNELIDELLGVDRDE